MTTAEQLALPRASAGGPDARGFAAPLLKWAGSKRWLAPFVGPALRARLARTGGRYIEPFLGGAALALWLGPWPALLGDIEAPLVECYATLARRPRAVAVALDTLVSCGVERHVYEAVRAHAPDSAPARAARLLYLNRLCFNGLYRTNRAGEFNVPFGRYKNPSFPGLEQLAQAGAAFGAARLEVGDFERLVDQAERGDVVFADPPYHGRFGSYAAAKFSADDQQRLAKALRRAARRGAVVIATNADTPEVRRWYGWADVSATAERRSISCQGTGRGVAPCVLVTTDSTLVRTPCGPTA